MLPVGTNIVYFICIYIYIYTYNRSSDEVRTLAKLGSWVKNPVVFHSTAEFCKRSNLDATLVKRSK